MAMELVATIDVAAARARFPALAPGAGGTCPVFADAPGGTQVPDTVIDAVAEYLRGSNANTGGAFATSAATDAVIAEARRAGADLLGGAPEEISFGANMTTLAFALSRSLVGELRPGDEVVVTALDHDANIGPWAEAARDAGARVREVGFDPRTCTLDLDELDAALNANTRIVAFTLASNALGTVTDAAEIVRLVRKTDALIIADAVHLVPHRVLDVATLDVDVAFCSAYKFFGPHVGIMYLRAGVSERLRAYKVRPVADRAPDRWETGTKNHEGLAGVVAAIDYIAGLTAIEGDRRTRLRAAMDAVARYELTLSSRFLSGISSLDRVRLYGPGAERAAARTPTFALRIADMHPRAAAEALAPRGIFTWDGDYYAPAVMERLGLAADGGAVRIGFCHVNTPEEVDAVVDGVAALTRV